MGTLIFFFFFFYPCIPALVLGRGGAGGSFGAWAGVRRLGGLLRFLGAVSIQNTFGQFALRCGPGKDLIFMWTSCRAVWSLSSSFQPPARAAVLMSRLAEFPRHSEQFLCFFFPCIFFPHLENSIHGKSRLLSLITRTLQRRHFTGFCVHCALAVPINPLRLLLGYILLFLVTDTLANW